MIGEAASLTENGHYLTHYNKAKVKVFFVQFRSFKVVIH